MRLTPLFAAALALLTLTRAEGKQADNLRGLQAGDLCPPAAYVTVDDKDDDDLAADLEGQLDKYATLYALKYGDQKTCSVGPYLTVDAFKTNKGSYAYVIEFEVELDGDAQVMQGGRSLTVHTPKLWSNTYYGTYASADDLKDGVSDRVRDYFDDFMLDWRAAHP